MATNVIPKIQGPEPQKVIISGGSAVVKEPSKDARRVVAEVNAAALKQQ